MVMVAASPGRPTGLLYDFSQTAIPTDNVDDEYLSGFIGASEWASPTVDPGQAGRLSRG